MADLICKKSVNVLWDLYLWRQICKRMYRSVNTWTNLWSIGVYDSVHICRFFNTFTKVWDGVTHTWHGTALSNQIHASSHCWLKTDICMSWGCRLKDFKFQKICIWGCGVRKTWAYQTCLLGFLSDIAWSRPCNVNCFEAKCMLRCSAIQIKLNWIEYPLAAQG